MSNPSRNILPTSFTECRKSQDTAERTQSFCDKEHAELFRFMIRSMSLSSERRPNGWHTLTYRTHGESGEGKKILEYYRSVKDERTREERYAEYLRLKNEFEGTENADRY